MESIDCNGVHWLQTLTKIPFKVGFNQLRREVQSTARAPRRHTFLKRSWKPTPSTSGVLGDVQTPASSSGLGQRGICRAVTADFSTLLAQGIFFHLPVSEGNQRQDADAALKSELLEATRLGGTSLHPQRATAFGRTCGKQEPGSTLTSFRPPTLGASPVEGSYNP